MLDFKSSTQFLLFLFFLLFPLFLFLLFDDLLEFGLFLLDALEDFLDQSSNNGRKDEDPVHGDAEDDLADDDEADQGQSLRSNFSIGKVTESH